MKSFLHHLNQALYDSNHLLWRDLLRPFLIYFIFAIFLFIISFVPVIYIDNEIFFYAWPVFSIIFCSYLLISYLAYDRSRNQPQPDEEVLFEGEENGFMVVMQPATPEPLTTKESLRKGLWWTGYIYVVFFLTILIVSTGAVVKEFSTAPEFTMAAICPDNFADTSEGSAAFEQETDDWVKLYLESYPFAPLEDVIAARQQSWRETGCTEALKEYEMNEAVNDADKIMCPTDASFPEIWNTWSKSYLADNIGFTGEDQIREWNYLMLEISCPDWVDPFKDAIDAGNTVDYE